MLGVSDFSFRPAADSPDVERACLRKAAMALLSMGCVYVSGVAGAQQRPVGHESPPMKILLFANTDWYLYNFRRTLAKAIQDAGHEVLLISPDGPYGEKLTALGLRWVPAPMDRRSLNPVAELRFLLWLRKLIVAEDIDLVHGFTIKAAVYGSLAARLAGRRRISAVAGLGFVFISDSLKAKLLRPLVRAMMRVAMGGKLSRVILQNPDDVESLCQSRIVQREQIRLIRGSGVDCARFTHCAKRTPGEPLRVLLAARLLWDKGINEYVEASRILKTEGRDIQFLLAGTPDPGNPAAVPEDTVRAWSEASLIEWLGQVDDMPTLLTTVHMMALPTYGEGLPRSLIEAGACGAALVTTDVPGCREVVTHEVDGLLVPVRDGPELARAVARLDDNQDELERYGQMARRKVHQQFDERIVIAETLAVYDELGAAPVSAQE